MCGEMASDPLCTLLLLGIGLDDLSAWVRSSSPSSSASSARSRSRLAEEVARDVRGLATAKEVKGYLFARMKELGIIELMDMYH